MDFWNEHIRLSPECFQSTSEISSSSQSRHNRLNNQTWNDILDLDSRTVVNIPVEQIYLQPNSTSSTSPAILPPTEAIIPAENVIPPLTNDTITTQMSDILSAPSTSAVNFLISSETLDSSSKSTSPRPDIDLSAPPPNLNSQSPPPHNNVILFQNPKHTAHPTYKSLWLRENSFSNWPRAIPQSPLQLSKAGFFYSQYGDMVICFSCGGKLKGWIKGCDPWEEHAIWFPQCSFIKLQKGASFVSFIRRLKISKLQTHTREELQEYPDPVNLIPSLGQMCVICFENPIQVALIPCGHSTLCTFCSCQITSCVICRSSITSVLRLFLE